MCRYAGQTYKSHFACFLCRKVFRKTAMEDYVEHVGLKAAHDKILFRQTRRGKHVTPCASYEGIVERYVADVSICPQCGKRMAAVGLDFKAPPHRKKKAWEILRVLYEHGFAFQGCGCSVGYAPPSRRADLPDWLRQHIRRSEGQLLLDAFARKRT